MKKTQGDGEKTVEETIGRLQGETVSVEAIPKTRNLRLVILAAGPSSKSVIRGPNATQGERKRRSRKRLRLMNGVETGRKRKSLPGWIHMSRHRPAEGFLALRVVKESLTVFKLGRRT